MEKLYIKINEKFFPRREKTPQLSVYISMYSYRAKYIIRINQLKRFFFLFFAILLKNLFMVLFLSVLLVGSKILYNFLSLR